MFVSTDLENVEPLLLSFIVKPFKSLRLFWENIPLHSQKKSPMETHPQPNLLKKYLFLKKWKMEDKLTQRPRPLNASRGIAASVLKSRQSLPVKNDGTRAVSVENMYNIKLNISL